jgi:phosphoribosyl-ATP pyrophosphohydrolase/phosphoribosyl-AMP cyclohydrolase
MIAFDKYNDGLAPVVIQDNTTGVVLMLGFMNEEALEQTKSQGRVTFFSRSKNRLWTKGETSGNWLNVVDILADCDQDTLLIKVKPEGPVCHTGADTCFKENNELPFLQRLEQIILERKNNPRNDSYTSKLFESGINKIAQKVGEEAVELVIESKDDNKELFLNESADLIYHLLVLLRAKNVDLQEVINTLKARHP